MRTSSKKPKGNASKGCRPRPAGSSVLPQFRGATRSPPEALPALPERAQPAPASGPRAVAGGAAPAAWLVSDVHSQQTLSLAASTMVLSPPKDLTASGPITERGSGGNGKVVISFTGSDSKGAVKERSRSIKPVALGSVAKPSARVIFQSSGEWHLGYVIGPADAANAGGPAPAAAGCPPGCAPVAQPAAPPAPPAARAPGPGSRTFEARRATVASPPPPAAAPPARRPTVASPPMAPRPTAVAGAPAGGSTIAVRDLIEGRSNELPLDSQTLAVPEDMDLLTPAERLPTLMSRTSALVRYRTRSGGAVTRTLQFVPVSSLVGKRALVPIEAREPNKPQALRAMDVGVAPSGGRPAASAPPPPAGTVAFEMADDGSTRYVPEGAVVADAPSDIDVARPVARIVGTGDRVTLRYHKLGVADPALLAVGAGPARDVLDALVLVDLGLREEGTGLPRMHPARRPAADVERIVRDRRAAYNARYGGSTLHGGVDAPARIGDVAWMPTTGETIAPGRWPRRDTVAGPPPGPPPSATPTLLRMGPVAASAPGQRDTVVASPDGAINLLDGGVVEFDPSRMVFREIADMAKGVAYLVGETEDSGSVTYSPRTGGVRTARLPLVPFSSIRPGEKFLGATGAVSEGRMVFVPMVRSGGARDTVVDSPRDTLFDTAPTGRMSRDTVLDAPRNTVVDSPRDTLFDTAPTGRMNRDTVLDAPRDTLPGGGRGTIAEARRPSLPSLGSPAPVPGVRGSLPAIPDAARRTDTTSAREGVVTFRSARTGSSHSLKTSSLVALAPDDMDVDRDATLLESVEQVSIRVRYTDRGRQQRERVVALVPVARAQGGFVLIVTNPVLKTLQAFGAATRVAA